VPLQTTNEPTDQEPRNKTEQPLRHNPLFPAPGSEGTNEESIVVPAYDFERMLEAALE
jgi:hypothetical protein